MDPEILELLVSPNTESTLQMLVFLTVVAFVPIMFLVTTPFLRILVVLYLLRAAVGVQTSPPNMVITVLSVVLTVFVMQGPLQEINEQALMPLARKEITLGQAMVAAYPPLKNRMLQQVEEKDIKFVYDLSDTPIPHDPQEIDFLHLLPAHILSELRIAFSLGFLIYIPFLVVDLIVANTLLALGMMMLSPVIISLPFKLMIFVGVDGWALVIRGLVESFH